MEAREPLPEDLLLEIAARCDEAATVVRCAVASKPLRRAILGPGFRHQLAGRLGPTAVLGLSFQPHSASTAAMVPTAHVAVAAGTTTTTTTTWSRPPQQPPTRPRVSIIDAGLLDSLEPVASRDGLLVLRRWGDVSGAGLSVRDTLTGDSTSLPSMELRGGDNFFLPPALLAVGGDRSFELLAAYLESGIKFRIFPSKDGAWNAARDVRCSGAMVLGRVSRAEPAVIGRRVHWLCHGKPWPLSVLAVDADAAEATKTPLPAIVSGSRMRPSCRSDDDAHSHVRLVAMEGRLGLLVAESLAVTMWTLTSPTRWDRRVVIGMQELERRAGLLEVDMLRFSPVVFLGFEEKSGTVVVLMMERHFVSLNLATKAVTTLWRDGSKIGPWVSQVCLHETDLATVLQAMKSF